MGSSRHPQHGMVGLIVTCGFIKSDVDPNLYYLVVENEPLILVLYVDELFRTGSYRLIKDCKKNLEAEFDMKDMGLMHYFLGLEVWQKNGEILLGQGRYATEIKNVGLSAHVAWLHL